MATAVSADPAPPVLVDTAVWIEYYRGAEDVVRDLDALMEAGRVVLLPLVLGELLRGARGDKEVAAINEMGVTFPAIEPPEDAWQKAGLLCFRMRRKGFFPGLADAYVAICVSSAGALVWSLDEHLVEIRDKSGLGLRLFQRRHDASKRS
jgi:predicted nucleic acid-binding protein